MIRTAIVTLGALTPAAAMAAVVSGIITGGTTPGTFRIIDPPPSAGGNDFASDDLFAWNERTGVVIPEGGLRLNHYVVLAAGTVVASHVVAFDPKPSRLVKAEVTFDQPIVGLIWSTKLLNRSDDLLSVPPTVWNKPGGRGLDARDYSVLYFSGNTVFIDWQTRSPGDMIRVLTADTLKPLSTDLAAFSARSGSDRLAVPEPATWAMLVAGFGLVGAVARRRIEAPSRATRR